MAGAADLSVCRAGIFLFSRSLFRPGVFHGNATALGWTGLGRGASLHADVFEIPAKGDDAVIEADAG